MNKPRSTRTARASILVSPEPRKALLDHYVDFLCFTPKTPAGNLATRLMWASIAFAVGYVALRAIVSRLSGGAL